MWVKAHVKYNFFFIFFPRKANIVKAKSSLKLTTYGSVSDNFPDKIEFIIFIHNVHLRTNIELIKNQ